MVTKASRCLALALISATQVFGQIDTISLYNVTKGNECSFMTKSTTPN